MNILVLDSHKGLGGYICKASQDYAYDIRVADMSDAMDSETLGRLVSEFSADIILDCTMDRSYAKISSDVASSIGVHLLYILEETSLYEGESYSSGLSVPSGCSCTLMTTSWLYGAEGFVGEWIERLADEPIVEVSSSRISSPTYMRDLAEAVMFLIDKGLPAGYKRISFCGEGVCSIYDFVVELNDRVGYLSRIVPVRTAEPSCVLPDNTAIRHDYGIEIPHWKDSLAACLMDMNVLPIEYLEL